jgi:hypothetical protein
MAMNLRDLVKRLDVFPRDASVVFDFCNCVPALTVHSYRGYYDQIAVGWQAEYEKRTVAEVVDMLRDAIDKTFSGWKGGNYRMGGGTPVWVDNPEDASGTPIVGVFDYHGTIVIETRHDRGW